MNIVSQKKWEARMRLAQEPGVGNVEFQVLERGDDEEETKVEI